MNETATSRPWSTVLSGSLVVLLIVNVMLDAPAHAVVGLAFVAAVGAHVWLHRDRFSAPSRAWTYLAWLVTVAATAVTGLLLWSGADDVRPWHAGSATAVVVLGLGHAAWSALGRRRARSGAVTPPTATPAGPPVMTTPRSAPR